MITSHEMEQILEGSSSYFSSERIEVFEVFGIAVIRLTGGLYREDRIGLRDLINSTVSSFDGFGLVIDVSKARTASMDDIDMFNAISYKVVSGGNSFAIVTNDTYADSLKNMGLDESVSVYGSLDNVYQNFRLELFVKQDEKSTRNLLLLEGDPFVTSEITNLLRQRRFSVMSTTSGTMGDKLLDRFADHIGWLVFSDDLQGQSGFEISFNATFAGLEFPKILMTDKEFSLEDSKLKKSGVAGIFKLPIDKFEVDSAVKNLLKSHYNTMI